MFYFGFSFGDNIVISHVCVVIILDDKRTLAFSAYLTLTSEQMLPLDLVLVLTNGPEKKANMIKITITNNYYTITIISTFPHH